MFGCSMRDLHATFNAILWKSPRKGKSNEGSQHYAECICFFMVDPRLHNPCHIFFFWPTPGYTGIALTTYTGSLNEIGAQRHRPIAHVMLHNTLSIAVGNCHTKRCRICIEWFGKG